MQLKDFTLKDFTAILASKSPTPGGGGASALGGSIGCALGSMTANLTLGKKKFEPYQDDIQDILEKLNAYQEELLEFITEDAQAFEPLSKAYRLPKSTQKELAYKAEIMEAALFEASLVPLKIMEKSLAVILLLKKLSMHCSQMAISDIAVGVQFLRSAILGASVNVYTNTSLMQNQTLAKELYEKTESLAKEGIEQADLLFENILQLIRAN